MAKKQTKRVTKGASGAAPKKAIERSARRVRKDSSTIKKTTATSWGKYLSEARFDDKETPKWSSSEVSDHRVSHERDFDRIVFSAPVRRLKDKTQVFPLDFHDGVRTRLTHSMEVSNLARSMGIAISSRSNVIAATSGSTRSVPALLAAVALAHDLGNPPFGHQGETAIRSWAHEIETDVRKFAGGAFDPEQFNDFRRFEGNAQGFRILTRLQHQNYRSGLRLTASTLAAFIKYPWDSNHAVARKKGKFGYFHSEASIYHWLSGEVGIKAGERHPLSYLMEICDDIAYSVLDVEDAIKKGLVGVAAFISYIRERDDLRDDSRCSKLLEKSEVDLKELSRRSVKAFSLVAKKAEGPLAINEIRDSMIELIRTYAIGLMVSDAVDDFISQVESGGSLQDISERFRSKVLMRAFKDFAKDRIYQHPDVLRAELAGHRVIPELLSSFWKAAVSVRRGVASKNEEYIFSMISPNYVRVCQESENLGLSDWYRLMQLVCDQVAGMTDSYCIRLHSKFRELGVA